MWPELLMRKVMRDPSQFRPNALDKEQCCEEIRTVDGNGGRSRNTLAQYNLSLVIADWNSHSDFDFSVSTRTRQDCL